MKIKPEALLFDMDGVLVNSINPWWKAFNESLKEYNKKQISKKEFIDNFWGHDLKSNLDKMNLESKVLEFCNQAFKGYVKEIRVYQGVKNTLIKLSEYNKSVITNTPKSCTNEILNHTNLKKFFDIVFTNDDVNLGKPNPEIVLKACRYFNSKPENVLLIGDTESDVKAGRQAGCKIAGINLEDADYKIENISQILNIIEY
ncbi:MAG: HAD-IA family hydrolase [Candidatus Thermoplasmatota archaeon]